MERDEDFSLEEQSTLLSQMEKRLLVGNHSEQTVRNYIRSVKYLCQHTGKHPKNTSINEIIGYLYYQKHNNHRMWRTMKLYAAGLLWYFKHIENNNKLALKIPYPREEQSLPSILSREELSQLFFGCLNQKHRTMLRLLYSSGLRRNELLNLKIEDIITQDGKFKIRINRSKGNKDRYTVLSKRILVELREYYKNYHPQNYLFNGRREGSPMSAGGLKHILSNAIIPAELRTLFLYNKRLLYNLLFKIVWETIESFSHDKRNRLEADMGMIAILHTWKQNLEYHPHLYCIIPAGGITSNNKWKYTPTNGNYMFNVEALGIYLCIGLESILLI